MNSTIAHSQTIQSLKNPALRICMKFAFPLWALGVGVHFFVFGPGKAGPVGFSHEVVLFPFFILFLLAVGRFGLALRAIASAAAEKRSRVVFFVFVLVFVFFAVGFVARVFVLHHRARGLLRFHLMGIVGLADGHGAAHLGSALLHDMSKFVSQEFAPNGVFGLVSALAEKDVLTGRKGAGAEGAAKGVGLLAGVDANSAEICAERVLHLPAHTLVEVLAATTLLLDIAFDVWRHFVARINVLAIDVLPRQGEDALDIAIAILPLKLKKGPAGACRLRGGEAVEGRRVSLSAGIIAGAANHAIHWISLDQRSDGGFHCFGLTVLGTE
jgi:hypothetical protein